MKQEELTARLIDAESGNDPSLEWSPPPKWLNLSRALDAIRRKNAEIPFYPPAEGAAPAARPMTRPTTE